MKSSGIVCERSTYVSHGPQPRSQTAYRGWSAGDRRAVFLGLGGAEAADHFQAVAEDLEALAAEVFEQIGGQAFQQGGVVGEGQVADLAGAFAAEVVVRLGAAVVADRAADLVGQAGGQPGVNQRLEGLV